MDSDILFPQLLFIGQHDLL